MNKYETSIRRRMSSIFITLIMSITLAPPPGGGTGTVCMDECENL